ncbi:MAG: AtpZ/AtpI family protein [Clostridiales bacterium]|nr:AtpZ/AtpI family protein [Clostridiales bacterium]
MKYWTGMMKHLTTLTQFGLSFVTPLLLCLGICAWMTRRFDIGNWVYLPGFFFGMGGSAMVAYKLYLRETRQQKKEKQKKVSFNRHS